jgi:hypothetical protein
MMLLTTAHLLLLLQGLSLISGPSRLSDLHTVHSTLSDAKKKHSKRSKGSEVWANTDERSDFGLSSSQARWSKQSDVNVH